MSGVSPARIGLLFDYQGGDGKFDENVLPTLQLVADDYRDRGVLERPVEFVVRHVQGLPKGSFRAVRDAFFELVEQDCLVIFGPWVSENGEPLREVESVRIWFAVPGMYGGFAYELRAEGEPHLLVESWSRVVGGSGQRHVIGAGGTRLVAEGFV